MQFEVEGIIMVARDKPGRSQDEAVAIADRQNVRRFGLFPALMA